MKSLVILGRQPALGIAELERLYGAERVQPMSEAALLDVEASEVAFDRLGGAIKLARVLKVLDTTQWSELEQYLHDTIPKHLQYVPEGKFTLGLSVYGLQVGPHVLKSAGLSLKRTIKNAGRSVRIVPNNSNELNSAQIIYNKLTSPNGWELILIRNGNSTILAQTYAVQDIDAYAARDQARPKRDARVGMLPPKLAQIIVNLASGQAQTPPATVLDPFCGTGVVLQEALLMGYNAYGTDLEPRMVEYSQANLEWLKTRRPNIGNFRVEKGDATSDKWPEGFDFVAAETYLGQPLTTMPGPEALEKIIANSDHIHQRFLRNLAAQTRSGLQLCLAVPAWQLKPGHFRHLPMLDRLTDMGYTRLSFDHVSNMELIYARPDQLVARELVVLTRI